MSGTIDRRHVIAALTGAIACSGFPSRLAAQGAAGGSKALIGLLMPGPPQGWDLTSFRAGLQDQGYVEGRNLEIAARYADNDFSRFPGLARELVTLDVRAIAVMLSGNAVTAAKEATDRIPIVFGYGINPVQQGHVARLDRPGANITGVTSLASELFGKQLGLLDQLVPRANRIGVLANPLGVQYAAIDSATHGAARALGKRAEMLGASSAAEIDEVFGKMETDHHLQALLVTNDPVYLNRIPQITEWASRLKLPSLYPFREYAAAGGFVSYGPNLPLRDREQGRYVGRILNGEKPANLPVRQIDRFELVINMKAATGLGLRIPTTIQQLADEVIE